MRFPWFVILIFCFGCTRFSNSFDQVTFDCGQAVESTQQNFYLFTDEGLLTDPSSLRVQSEKGEDLSSWVTPKACLLIPHEYKAGFIVSDTKRQSGVSVRDTSTLRNQKTLFLRKYAYETVDSTCRGTLATALSEWEIPLSLSAEELAAYQWQLSITHGEKLAFQSDSVERETSRKSLNLSSLEDGKYQMSIALQELHSLKQRRQSFSCSLIIDRKAPFVSLKSNSIRQGDVTSLIRVAPGAPIFFQVGEDVLSSNAEIYYCLSSVEKPLSACAYTPLKNEFLSLPEAGRWNLTFFAKDQAGNQGEFETRTFLVQDDNAIEAVLTSSEKSKALSSSGDWLASLAEAVKAFEDSTRLKADWERELVEAKVREGVYTALQPLREELRFQKSYQGGPDGVGLLKYGKQWLYAQTLVSSADLALYTLDGKAIETLSLPSKNSWEAGWKSCRAEALFIGFSKNQIQIIRDYDHRQIVDLPRALSGTSLELNADCSLLIYQTDAQGVLAQETILLDLHEMKFHGLGKQYAKALGIKVQDARRRVLVEDFTHRYAWVDLESKQEVPFDSQTSGQGLREILILRNGDIAQLSDRGNLRVFDSQQRVRFEQESVDRIVESLEGDRLVYLQLGQGLFFLKHDSQSPEPSAIPLLGNLAYLGVSGDFVVSEQVDSRSIIVWTKNGHRIEEIYAKGDPIRRVWLDRDGLLYIGTERLSRLLRVDRDLQARQVPPLWAANGIHFAKNDEELVYKSMISSLRDREPTLFAERVKWDIQTNFQTSLQKQTWSVPTYQGVSLFPGYGPQVRSFAIDPMSSSEDTIFALEGMGDLVVFDKNSDYRNSEATAEGCTNWALDIAVKESLSLVALACQDGYVYLWDKALGEWTSLYGMREAFPDSPGNYPVTLAFDQKGTSLYVTDLFGHLLQLELSRGADKLWILRKKAVATVEGAFVAVSPWDGTVALLAKDSRLHFLTPDMDLKESLTLGSSWGAMPTGLLFANKAQKLYASSFDGSWMEMDLVTREKVRVSFTSIEDGARNFALSKDGQRLAYTGGGFVQVVDLSVENLHKKICRWLKPRLNHLGTSYETDRYKDLCRN